MASLEIVPYVELEEAERAQAPCLLSEVVDRYGFNQDNSPPLGDISLIEWNMARRSANNPNVTKIMSVNIKCLRCLGLCAVSHVDWNIISVNPGLRSEGPSLLICPEETDPLIG